jgi:hypothetical protein
MYDRVVTINNTHWPAYRKPGATLVDLRMFDPNDRSSDPRLVFRPEKLRELGIPDALIEAAAKSDPQGFLLFDDLPDQTKQASKPTKPQLDSGQFTTHKSTKRKAKNRRCLMASEGNGFTHYVVSKEVVLGEACIIDKCNEWISLAFIKLGIDRPEAVIERAFIENHALVPKTAN